jgi:TctA family transporter
VILGPLMEAHFRRKLVISDGDFGAFLDRTFAVVVLLLALARSPLHSRSSATPRASSAKRR